MWHSTIFIVISILHLSTSASLCGPSNEIPIHNNVPPMTTTSPYSILTSVSTAHQSEIVTVRIKSALSELKFMGFTVHAVSTSQGEIVGRFTPSRVGLQLSNCDSEDNIATYHAYPEDADDVELQWQAPTNYEGEILFNATVVRDYDTFWVGITSNPLKVVENKISILDKYLNVPTIQSSPIAPLQGIEPRNRALIYEGCGLSKTCVGMPLNCEQQQTCEAVATATIYENRFIFELQSSTAEVGYVSLGLSRSPLMGDCSVMECVQENGNVRQYNSWNLRRSNNRDGVPQNITTLLDSSFNDGTIYCKFERETLSEMRDTRFDLDVEKFYFLMATGRTFSAESIGRHDLGRDATREPVRIIRENPIYRGCGLTKTCVGMPLGCELRHDCDAVVTATNDDNRFIFELQSASANIGYVALGLSRTPRMGDCSVMECVQENGNVQQYNSWNLQRGNTRVGVPQNITTLLTSSFTEGTLYCKFERDPFSDMLENRFDLPHERFYFLIATGTTFTPTAITRHDINRTATIEPVRILRQNIDPIYQECGTNKTCYGIPHGCLNNYTCLAVVTVLVIEDQYEFELQSDDATAAYVSFGLSRDRLMGDDSVIECVLQNHQVRAHTSWNIGRTNTRTGVDQEIITPINSSYSDGRIYCKVGREQSTVVLGNEFHLAREDFFFMLAVGTSFTANGIGMHDIDREVSEEVFVLPGREENASNYVRVSAMAIVAWLMATSCANFFRSL